MTMTSTKPVRTRTPMRRGQKTAITLGLAFLLLVGAALWGMWAVFQDPTREAEQATVALAPCPPPEIQPGQVSINVYNASGRSGLARLVADGLAQRGFVLATIANDPLAKEVPTAAEIRHGPGGVGQAQLVATQVPGAVLIVDTRPDASVDVAVGDTFTELTPLPTTGPDGQPVAAPLNCTPPTPAPAAPAPTP
jgi:LytR cell envelope-related transcriptional attenuator